MGALGRRQFELCPQATERADAELQRAPVERGQFLHDGQAQAAARGRFLQAAAASQGLAFVGFWNAWPVVFDGYAQVRAGLLGSQHKLAAGGLASVVQQIAQQYLQVPCVILACCCRFTLTTRFMPVSIAKKPNPRQTRTVVLLVMLTASFCFWWFAQRGDARRQSGMEIEYRLYKSESRKPVRLKLSDVSSIASEADLHRALQGHQVVCQPDWTGVSGAKTACAVYTNSYNGVPAMYLNFIFSEVALVRMGVAIPQEAHEEGFKFLESEFGTPTVTQSTAKAGIRLHGWKLADGAAVFYGRERAKEAFEPSSIQWMPQRGCGGRSCIH